MTPTLYIAAAGLTCPIGLSLAPACAALRAGLKRFADSSYLDNSGERIVCSASDSLNRENHGARLVSLLGSAIADAARAHAPNELSQMPLILGCARPDRPGSARELAPRLLAHLADRHGLRFAQEEPTCVATGSTAGLRAVERARQLMAEKPGSPGCIVAAADSLTAAPALEWLERHRRLRRPGRPDAVIPGEAGAALIVSTRPLRLAPRQARIAGLGFATEREPSRGLGIAEAARLALREADLDLAEIDFRISDAAGEPYAFKELALMLARLLRRKRERFPLWLPSESLGYTGAASALVGLAVAFQAFRRGYAPGPRALVSAAGSTGDRAVAVLCDAPERGSA